MTIPRNASYADWARHFGQSTLDPALVAEFHAAGITKIPVIARDHVEASEDVGALTVTVTDPIYFGNEGKYGDGVGIFSGISIHLEDYGDEGYTGQMPFAITRDDTRKTLRKKLGKPSDSDEEDAWDEWIIDGLVVTALYSEDFKEFMTLTVYLPEEV
ncbi:hypothetical protein [Paracoccus lutimaris]|uniref:Uncharacterized protein n=1 Tax=Paracoccus lutimaris TaxID=1490030 RepID=A0A368ZAX4_9RHOB|nr:hypothetical protein [Paracoccus lutimaris]RCW88626.1 hypothetical protein DFP89_10158 [Paracoccus lutimaris]